MRYHIEFKLFTNRLLNIWTSTHLTMFKKNGNSVKANLLYNLLQRCWVYWGIHWKKHITYLWTTKLIRGQYVEIGSSHLYNEEQRESRANCNHIYIKDIQSTCERVDINVEQRKLVFSIISRLIKRCSSKYQYVPIMNVTKFNA